MSYYTVITEAVNDIVEHGFDSQVRIDSWVAKIKHAANMHMASEAKVRQDLERALRGAYTRLVTKGGLVSKHISRFTVDKLSSKLRADLDRRIIASASLIKRNRAMAISQTLQRFEGWATSIPAGGTRAADKVAEKDAIRKHIVDLPFREKRVIIDQTHKLIANINEVVALDSGAIAFKWRSHWQQPGYDYREDHKERDDVIYLVRDSWADKASYVKPVNGYYDQITAVGEEPYCRCYLVGIYTMAEMPVEFLTEKYKNKVH